MPRITAGTVIKELGERLWEKIPLCLPAAECWPWQGAKGKSGRRQVYYGNIREGSGRGRMWKAHRLVLVLTTGPTDVPPDPDESFLDWLSRARRHYKGLEASHTCDHSLCCNPGHLVWETHQDNLKNQRMRDRARASLPAAKESAEESVA